MSRSSLVALALAVVAVAAQPGTRASAAGSGGECGETKPAVVAYRGQEGSIPLPGLRVSTSTCDFVVSCPAGAPCRVDATVEVAGDGLVEATVEGIFGELNCGPVLDACVVTVDTLIPPGTITVVECSTTGVAIDVTYRCAITPR